MNHFKVFILFIFLFAAIPCPAQNRQLPGETLSMNDNVLALTIYDGNLVAGGEFTTASDSTVNRIAIWDGSTWSSLDSGMDYGNVNALCVYNNKLIAGGWFFSVSGQPMNCIAAWDGNSWSPLGNGVNGEVHDLIIYNGNLIACGYFS